MCLNRFLFYPLLMILFCMPCALKGSEAKTNINRGWRFLLGDSPESPVAATFDDSSWEHVGLPHSFSIPYFRGKDFYVGEGWYRKTLIVDENPREKRIFLDFDGIFQESEIYVNGRFVTRHQGGYIGFTTDITPYVSRGENTLAIKVNNRWNARLAPRAGEHVFAGGIYRDAYLRIENPVHVAWNGTFVTTPSVSEKEATVRIVTEIQNDSEKAAHCIVKQIIRNKAGKKIAVFEKAVSVAPNRTETVEQESGKIDNPQLWTPENPVLYSVETLVTENGKKRDSYRTPFGFRWFEWSAEKGFFLNGNHYFLRGVNVHQDHAGWGDAVTQAGIHRDLKLMKDAGFNMIRGSHYPHHPYFAQVCDELGLLFMSENNVWGIGGHKEDGYWDASIYPPSEADQPQYEATAYEALERMIRINRNHPSILAWSMCNEPFFTYPELMDKVKNLLSGLVDASHRFDPSRIAIIGGAQRGDIDVLGDAAGYNGDGATLFRNPGFPNLVSEYGSCVTDRPGEYDACWGHVTDGERPEWRAGHAIWCGFDHGSIAGDMGKMGIVDFFRIPKRSWYWYRHHHLGIAPPEWPREGMATRLSLGADKKILRGTDGTDDALVTVTVCDRDGVALSNSPTVTLTIVSGPGEFPTGRKITFKPTTEDDIRIQDGIAAIEFRSYEGGKTVIEASSPGLQSDKIVIETKGTPLYREGVTPLARDRAFDPAAVYLKALHKKTEISRRRPTQASSVAPGSNSAFANDGDKNTAWETAAGDGNPWFCLDMENFYKISEVTLFTEDDAAGCVVEISRDNRNWKPVSGNVAASGNGGFTISCDPETEGRFMRLLFPPGKIRITDMDVMTGF